VIFGKLPSHGDFVYRGLDDAARAAWDEWASAGLAQADAELGERFDAAHDTAPPWCFISGPGPFGEGWRVGAFAPSADSAGRRFVIVVAIDDLSLADAMLLGPRTAAALIDAIYRMFSAKLDADEALEIVVACAQEIGGTEAAALGRLLAAREEGVWWPHIDGADTEQICTGAVPARDLLPRALRLLQGDAAA
jgi:type VI secretion system protein ImpM